MAKTVTARFESEEEAERALALVAAEVPLRDSAVVGADLAGSLTLDSLRLAPEERSACEQQLSKGGFLLVAQVATEARGETVLGLLDRLKRGSAPEAPHTPAAESELPAFAAPAVEAPPQAAPQPAPGNTVRGPPVAQESRPPAEAAPPPVQPAEPQPAVAEERIPIVEEELRIGKREVVRGRSRVRSFVAEIPVQEEVELLYEETHLERRPVNRRLSEEEVVQGGLLQERVIEVAEMREEAVVTKEAFVREELVVTKSVHRRVERIDETVRRTEVETERLLPEESAAGR